VRLCTARASISLSEAEPSEHALAPHRVTRGNRPICVALSWPRLRERRVAYPVRTTGHESGHGRHNTRMSARITVITHCPSGLSIRRDGPAAYWCLKTVQLSHTELPKPALAQPKPDGATTVPHNFQCQRAHHWRRSIAAVTPPPHRPRRKSSSASDPTCAHIMSEEQSSKKSWVNCAHIPCLKPE
jgi:hypothetical protein